MLKGLQGEGSAAVLWRPMVEGQIVWRTKETERGIRYSLAMPGRAGKGRSVIFKGGGIKLVMGAEGSGNASVTEMFVYCLIR